MFQLAICNSFLDFYLHFWFNLLLGCVIYGWECHINYDQLIAICCNVFFFLFSYLFSTLWFFLMWWLKFYIFKYSFTIWVSLGEYHLGLVVAQVTIWMLGASLVGSGEESTYQCRRHGFGKIPWRRAWKPTPEFLPGESHGQRSLVGCSPQGHRVGHEWSNLTHTREKCHWEKKLTET